MRGLGLALRGEHDAPHQQPEPGAPFPTRPRFSDSTSSRTSPADGRPHTGKNWDRTFTNPKCPITPKLGAGLKKMQAQQDKYDPKRVFEPELWTRSIKGEKFWSSPKCTLGRTCYCEQTSDCADGFECIPSNAFPEYMTCRPKVWN